MNPSRHRPSFAALLLALLMGKASASALEFTRCLAIAAADRVRVEVALKLEADAEVELTGHLSRVPDGQLLWQGPLGRVQSSGRTAVLSHTVDDLQPDLWSPNTPTLYHLEVTARSGGLQLAAHTVRFGFRSFEARAGQFWLNGRPIFLRGIAINPPGRTIPQAVGESRQFAEDYVRFLKAQNVNCFRITTDKSPVWFDVCDELGMLLYAGRYGAPPGADEGKRVVPTDPDRVIAGYRKLLEGYSSHPSIVMYLLANELPVSGERGAAFSALLTRAHEELRRWDDTRPYIGNAGYGEGREGDVCDVHRYWGWYYNSFLTYYNLRDRLYPQPLFGDPAKNQPLTFTECVGSFTGSSGEFNVVRSKQLAPRLGWIGHTATPQADALEYQAFMTRQAGELFRRMRPLNPRLAGLMPFTILFYNWAGIASFADMKPKPVADALRLAYQPVLLSWELWTPQVYAGTTLRPVAHVVNDDDDHRPLTNATLEVVVRADDGREFVQTRIALPALAYFDVWRQPLTLDLPAHLPEGDYWIAGRVMADGELRSTNGVPLFVARRAPSAAGAVRLNPSVRIGCYDPSGRTVAALRTNGIQCESIASPARLASDLKVLLLGENAWDDMLRAAAESLRQFVRAGGRVLCLAQDAARFDGDWLPVAVEFLTSSPNDPHYPPLTRPFREQMNVNPERPWHPVFAGLDRRRLRLWSDYTGWDQTQPGFPRVYPVTAGFKLRHPAALEHTAILADYDRGLEGVALAEMFDGAGSVLLCGFDLVRRAGLDPVADRLLVNLVAYAGASEGHEVHPLVEAPIRWADFPSERGTVCGSLNGLLPNTEWIPAPDGPRSPPLPANTGAWNMQPGDQFVPQGRQPFGAYGYSTASSLRLPTGGSGLGSGFFWARVPAGRRFVVTTVRNPASVDGTMAVSVNDHLPAPVTVIASGQSVVVRTPLPVGATNLCVRYTGPRTLVLMETAFE